MKTLMTALVLVASVAVVTTGCNPDKPAPADSAAAAVEGATGTKVPEAPSKPLDHPAH
jgi:hypothetical protein